jgi:hypothetical protein
MHLIYQIFIACQEKNEWLKPPRSPLLEGILRAAGFPDLEHQNLAGSGTARSIVMPAA